MTQNDLKEALKNAMREKDTVRLAVIRGLLTAATNDLVAKGKKPTDEISEDDLLALIRRAAKQRKDSIEQFTKGGRQDLVASEEAELTILSAFLPAQMSETDIEAAVKAKATELGVDKSKANQLIGALMRDLKGKADGTLVKAAVDKFFA